MKKNCLIVINSFSKSKSLMNKANRLKEELEKKGVFADIKKTIEIPLIIKDSKTYIEGIDKYCFSIFLDKDKYLIDALSLYMPVINSFESTMWCDDKALTYLRTLNINVKTPLTITAPLCYETPNQEDVDKFLNYLMSKIKFPMVCKQAYGSLGKQVYLINNKEELYRKYNELHGITHLYQEYVGKDIHSSEDYRIITVGGKTIAFMKRVNYKDFRSNIGLGGKGEKIDKLPQNMDKIAEKISKKLKLDYAGIDLLFGKNNEVYFLEANSNAFFEEIEKITSVNIAEEFVDFCLKKLKIIV